MPEVHFLIGRFFRAEVGAPVVREALKSGTLGGRQTPDGISALDSTRTFCHQCRLKLLFKGRSELGVLTLVEGISANAVADGGRVFVIPCEDGRRFFLGNLGEAACCHTVHGMAVNGIEGKTDILVDAIALGTVFVLTADHGALQHKGLLFRPCIGTHNSGAVTEVTHLITLILRESDNGNAALVAGGVAAVPVKRPCGFRFVDAAVRIIRLHGVGILGADAEGLKDAGKIVLVRHPLISTCVLLGKRGRDLSAIPAARLKQRLVVVAGQGCGFVFLNERNLAAAFAAGADLHHKRHIVAASPHAGGQRLYIAVLGELDPAVGRMVFQCDRCRNNACTERGRAFFLIADGAAFCGMLGAEARRLHDTGRMSVVFCSERCSNILGHLQAAAALVVQHDAVAASAHSAVHAEGGGSVVCQSAVVPVEACRSSARRKTSGSSLPRAEALRRIPRQAL